jgi:hypothetical protein
MGPGDRGAAVRDSVRPQSAAAYIADITAELAGMARSSKLDILAYLLEIAQLEAASAARRLSAEEARS